MRRIPDEDIKNIELKILKYIDDICSQNGIQYSLAYGTLLGAIRHRGFIPWDDDIDICMDRKNFNRFMVACRENSNDRYELLWLDTNDTYTLPLPKVVDKTTVLTQNAQIEKMPLGIYVDVFIYDNIPNDPGKRRKYINKLELYQRFWGYSQNKLVKQSDHPIKSFVRSVVYRIFHLINPRLFSKLLNTAAQKYNENDDCEYIGSMVYSTMRNTAWFRKEFLVEFQTAEFAGSLFPISKLYDHHLRICYEDYMELPPVEKRVSHHDFDAFYL